MAWRRIGDKPLSEPMLTGVTDAYMRHKGEMSQFDIFLKDVTTYSINTPQTINCFKMNKLDMFQIKFWGKLAPG